MSQAERSKRAPRTPGPVSSGKPPQLLREILELLPSAVVFLGCEGRVVYANAGARDLFCRRGERLVGKTRAFCIRRGIFDAQYLEQVDRATSETMYFLEDVRDFTVKAGGKRIDIRARYRPVALGGQFSGVLGTFEDITTAKESAQLRDDLLFMLFHDMKHPLSAIMLNLDGVLLLGDDNLTEQQQQFIDTAKQKVQQLHGMFAKMVDINKLEQRQLPLTLVSFDMNDLVEGVLRETFALQFDKAGKRLLFAPSKHLLPVSGDVALVQRVVANLVDNGMKFTKAGSAVEVRTALGPDRKSVVVHVRDQGPGVPAKFRHVIFEKYRQVHMRKAGVKTGVGLGLALCKLAVEAHGGVIGVKPISSGGADFFFRLPCSPLTAP